MAEHIAFDAPQEPTRRPSLPRMFFLDPLTRDLHRNWDELARVHVAYLRLTAGRFPTDARLAELTGHRAGLHPKALRGLHGFHWTDPIPAAPQGEPPTSPRQARHEPDQPGERSHCPNSRRHTPGLPLKGIGMRCVRKGRLRGA
ncbi:hypothetical protein AB0C18_29075 [Nonomuraea muscovyensis]|uniref:MmyB family transcriptional regulator n=1 Tax=Nonomuraea muscovyensis TaxID=1124761 RepID=UPI0033CC8E62